MEALLAGGSKGLIEFAKIVPGLSVLVEGIRAYQENIEEQQKRDFIASLTERLKNLEAESINAEWYQSEEGIEVTKKIIGSALNPEYADKVSYFANALINSSGDYEQDERLKFIEILRHISKPALKILAKERGLHLERGRGYSPQVLVSELIKNTTLEPHLVEACVNELFSIGVFSHTVDFDKNGRQRSHFENGTAAYTKYTDKIINFLLDPEM